MERTFRKVGRELDPKSGAPLTPDIGGEANTADLGKAIADAL
jgi:tartrate dehydrogenase/decarboxylase / D-malate dehydrogenase